MAYHCTKSINQRNTSGRYTNTLITKAVPTSCVVVKTSAAAHPAAMVMTTIRMHTSSTTVWNLNLRQCRNSVLLRVV